jgi:hypothetical protein
MEALCIEFPLWITRLDAREGDLESLPAPPVQPGRHLN